MSLGVHFALSAKDTSRLLKFDDPDELVEFITEDLEERYLENDSWSFESDKAWDAIHRSLTDGRLLYESGPFPLAYAVLGGRPLDAGEDYTACFVNSSQVMEVTEALQKVTKEWMQQRYSKRTMVSSAKKILTTHGSILRNCEAFLPRPPKLDEQFYSRPMPRRNSARSVNLTPTRGQLAVLTCCS